MDGLKGLAMEGSSAKNEKSIKNRFLFVFFILFFGGFCLLCWLNVVYYHFVCMLIERI